MNIREPKISDMEHIVELMNQLGYSVTHELIEKKFAEFHGQSCDQIYVAEIGGNVVGCVSCHITSLFHKDGSLGRITSLVVNANYRSKGIGQRLVETADRFFFSKGCIGSEVTSGSHRKTAHKFYQSCGYKKTDGQRFLKTYSPVAFEFNLDEIL